MSDWTDRLRLRQLRMLISLARTQNVSRSAEELSTTQPALSKWLRELEEDVGLPLFERHARGLRPTPHGESFIEHARRITAQLDSARDDMGALRKGGQGLMSVGTSGASVTETVPMAVTMLLERMPNVQVRVVEGTMELLMSQLARGEIDIVVGRSISDLPGEGISNETLYMEPLHFVARPNHPLTKSPSPSWEELRSYRWIVWHKGAPVRSTLEAAVTEAGQSMPANSIVSNSLIANLTMLNHSDMIGIASRQTARRFKQMGVLSIIPMSLTAFGSTSMYWREDAANRAAVSAMLDTVRQCAVKVHQL
jgi:DNA-binding transcriptional LysR family regulator